ncbi:alpha-xylosidase [Prevotella sp. tf2-5]|uniref:glycoside hydrolase family 31 protein n=1 Tax=Prevotella sp. tf2-5 TaxID=1761889 RepID=UPI0008DF5F8C|nr:alpha-xylosidase [Prevotella sp. tf2-5]SFO66385.1 alpha-D-xyloside xylohydrolase [Prevotella sp. tf2-5]
MKQTNYHLFDFMDFDPTMQREEALWKAYAPTSIVERDGDIVVTIPYQQQRHQEDMAPDMEAAQQSYDLIIRAYEPNIIRLFTTMTDDQMTESDEMLLMAPEVKRKPLRYVDGDVIATDGTKVANINLSEPRIDPWSDLLPAPQPAPLITFYPDGDTSKPVALSDDHFSPPRYDALPLGFCSVCCNDTATKNERATISFKCDADEHFVGTGERFRKMDLSGQTFQLKNQDGQGVNNRRCYKNIPFYLSSRMYGVFFHTSDYCKLSLADHSSRSVQFLCDHATLDVFLIGGQTPEEILKGYRMLTGFPAMPPLWSFGIWMSRMTYFSADEVEDICNRLRQEHYPCDVIHLDTGWFRTDWLCEWRFNPERFPDPKGFISRLKENGFKVSLWQLPYIAQGAEQLEEAKKNHYISQPTKEEETSTGGASNFSALDYAGTIDFTYPKATDWYKYSLLKPLLDMGVKCIKTDFGENIHMDHQYHSSSPERLNNIYALLYQKAAYEVTREVAGDGIIWARAGWAGCQRYPLHWGGDSESSWAGMAGSLKGGLHLGLSGFAFWSHDVPGFHSTPDFMNSPLDEQVYVRWTQFGVFTSHMRYHGTCKREPWHYPTIAPIVKRWWKLRYRLIPYIIEQSELACRSGLPIVQALLIHHPNDRQVWHIDDEYYFGNEFLVCPVMNAENRRDIYLPEGQWVHFLTGERLEGGRWYNNVEVPLDEMPVFVRPDARIKMYPHDVDSTDDMDLEKAITIEITKEYKGI